MDKRLITVSKYLAKYLRHAPQDLGLTLQPGGWVPIDDLLAAARKHGFPITLRRTGRLCGDERQATVLPSTCRAN